MFHTDHLLLTFVRNMFDGNKAVLVECYKVHLLIMEQKLNINAIYI